MSDFGDMAKRVGRLSDKLEEEHERATKESMGTIQTEVQNEIRANDSVARQVLVSDVRENRYTSSKMVARSVNVPEWAKYLEHGTGPKAREDTQPDHEQYKAPDPLPPFDPILTWVIAKNLTSEEYDSKTALAEAIMQSIGEEGTYPHPFLRPVWYGARGYQNVVQANKNAMTRALRRM